MEIQPSNTIFPNEKDFLEYSNAENLYSIGLFDSSPLSKKNVKYLMIN